MHQPKKKCGPEEEPSTDLMSCKKVQNNLTKNRNLTCKATLYKSLGIEHLLTRIILTIILVHEHCNYPQCSVLSTSVLGCCTEYVPGQAGCLHRRSAGAGAGVHRTVDGVEVGRRSLHPLVELHTGLVVQGRGRAGVLVERNHHRNQGMVLLIYCVLILSVMVPKRKRFNLIHRSYLFTLSPYVFASWLISGPGD